MNTSTQPNSSTEGTHDVADDSKVAATTTTPKPSTTKEEFSDFETKYEFVSWSKLPHKDAAKALGFDETMWDTEESHPEGWWKHWDHLTEEERKGAETLGWDEAAWDHKYEHSNFADIPKAVQRAAIFVGFDAASWDAGKWPEGTHDKSWEELTEEEKRAYSVFGYTQPTWDH